MPAASPFRAAGDGVRVAVRLTPKASHAGVRGLKPLAGGGAELDVTVTAPADRNRANEAMIRLLSGLWRLPPGRLALVAGQTARHKTVHVAGAPGETLARLESWLGGIGR